MSYSRFFKSKTPISLDEWKSFCDEADIRYSPNTIGRNVFYSGDTEICFGRPLYDDLPKDDRGRLRFDLATPRQEATEISVSTSWGSRSAVDKMYNQIKRKFIASPR